MAARRSPWRLAILALVVGMAAAPGMARAVEVEVRVLNVASGMGTVRAEICRPDEWLKDGCAHKSVAKAVKGVTTVVFRDVEPGVWAVVVFHDRNNDGEVARNILGIPTEGIGFSENPSLGLSGPSYAASAFTVGPQGAVVDVRLKFE